MQIKETSSVAAFDDFFGMSDDDVRLSIYKRTLKEDEKNPNVYSSWAKYFLINLISIIVLFTINVNSLAI